MRLDTKRCGQLIKAIDADAVFAAFKGTDIGSVYTGGVCERFL